MARRKVTVDLSRIVKGLDSKKINDQKTLTKVGTEVVKEMKADISKGKSPVRGFGRFPGYAKQRLGRGYPDGIPGKRKRPVNLKLSGAFLRALKFKPKKGKFVRIGMIGASKKIRDMFATHNDGTHKHVPQRQFLPTGEKDQFTPRITRIVKNIYKRRIERLIFDLNKR
jgi:hypothetical protein